MRRSTLATPPRRTRARSFAPEHVGLFAVRSLTRPDDFALLAKRTVKNLEEQVKCVRQIPMTPVSTLLRAMDRISDTLSLTLDTAELCRNVHPQEAWRQAADEAYSMVMDYVHHLNADASLYARVLGASHGSEVMNEEEHAVLASLLADARAGGVLLAPEQRPHVVALQQQAARLSARFARLCAEPAPYTLKPLAGLLSDLRTSPLPAMRRAAYVALAAPAEGAEACVTGLLQTRTQLAQAVGEASFAHLALRGKVLTSPDAVQALLTHLSDALVPYAASEMALLRAAKCTHEHTTGANAGVDVVVEPWDRIYYCNLVKQQHGGAIDISAYLPLSVCVPALQELVQRVFGLTLCHTPPANKTELWHHTVQKLQLIDSSTDTSTDVVLGTLYLDLHARPHKMPGAANFVLENAAQSEHGQWRPARVVLVTSFANELLSHSDLETLMHEAGHSLACLLSRTTFQTVSGVRCVTDWVETPSTLFEHYAWDHDFVSLFAKHHTTGAPLPPDLWRGLAAQRHMFAALDLQEQVYLSALDLTLHSAPTSTILESATATVTAHTLEARYTSFKPVAGTAQQTRFAHLSNYASTYYSYLFSRLSAAAIWQRHMARRSLTRPVGRLLQDELLAHGGARDPKVILHRLLGDHVPDVRSLLDEIKQH